MKIAKDKYRLMVAQMPPEIKAEINLSFEISNRIEQLMQEKGMSKKQFAEALGKRPCEVTKWLSGQHNFTVATLAMISTFFGQSVGRIASFLMKRLRNIRKIAAK